MSLRENRRICPIFSESSVLNFVIARRILIRRSNPHIPSLRENASLTQNRRIWHYF
ncbi:hypothetical protein [Helicobacter sp. 23-1045]